MANILSKLTLLRTERDSFIAILASSRLACAAAGSHRRSFPLRGPLPFSGANAAFGYLPLQLALQTDVRKLKLVRGKGGFADKVGEIEDSFVE